MKDILMQMQKYTGIFWADDYDCKHAQGMNCYSFVRFVLQSENIAYLPEYTYCAQEGRDISLLILSKIKDVVNSVKKEDRKAWDLVLMEYRGYNRHIGLYIGHNKIIHCIEPVSIISDFSDQDHFISIEHRIKGFYRCR
jgi:hypothetical protein